MNDQHRGRGHLPRMNLRSLQRKLSSSPTLVIKSSVVTFRSKFLDSTVYLGCCVGSWKAWEKSSRANKYCFKMKAFPKSEMYLGVRKKTTSFRTNFARASTEFYAD